MHTVLDFYSPPSQFKIHKLFYCFFFPLTSSSGATSCFQVALSWHWLRCQWQPSKLDWDEASLCDIAAPSVHRRCAMGLALKHWCLYFPTKGRCLCHSLLKLYFLPEAHKRETICHLYRTNTKWNLNVHEARTKIHLGLFLYRGFRQKSHPPQNWWERCWKWLTPEIVYIEGTGENNSPQ